MKKFSSLAISILFASVAFAGQETAMTPMQAFAPTSSQSIVINNRPLARVNGKTFSLLDVVKEMNIFIQTNYPQLLADKPQLYQFYQGNWKDQLSKMIENEMILADAAEKEVEVSDGDVREELEERYGGKIFTKLAELDITLEEIKEQIRNEIIIRKMTFFRAYNKAIQAVNPQLIREAYAAQVANFEPKENWEYDVITLRGTDDSATDELSALAYTLMNDEHLGAEETADKINAQAKSQDLNVIASASTDYSADTSRISKQHLEVLQGLDINAVSQPAIQKTRQGANVRRIFHLRGHDKDGPQPFEELAQKLQERLTDFQAGRERSLYIESLKKKFSVKEEDENFPLPDLYQPFALI